MNELIGLAIGFIFTLFIYSYIFGDNPLYRLAVHILVGVSAAYASIVVVRQVLIPIQQQIRENPSSTQSIFWLVPILFVTMLLLRRLHIARWLGNTTLAFLIGIGAAVSLVGALDGTLWPQITQPGSDSTVQTLLVAGLTICTLLTFRFTSLRGGTGVWETAVWQRLLGGIGRVVLAITFGALFASLLSTSLILLADRLGTYLDELVRFLS